MTLDIDIRHRLGTFTLDTQFRADHGLIALLGRSGSGKTSVVNVIAGLIRPDEGHVTIDGEALFDSARRIFLPPHKRRLGYVFQDDRLFPHMTVAQNLGYGRWFARIAADPAEFANIVDLLGIAHLLERRPSKLSGGEKQRVAIGRALLSAPRLLLMDEPLASLDDQRKQEVMPYLERLRDEMAVPILYVSHSVPEVARLATSIILLSEGRVAAQGTPAELLPRVDLFPLLGRAEAGAVVEATVEGHDDVYGLTTLRSAAGLWRVPRVDAPAGMRLRLRVRARDVMLSLSRPAEDEISALNVFAATVTEIGRQEGVIVDVRLDCSGEALVARVTRLSVDRLGLKPGVAVHALVKSVALERRSLSRRQAEG
jgi:molybdate transport system ATP-binding protein